ncbi:MAG: hypothetical protein J6W53_00205, partial [Candidatus Methanomethylophilaceae archaeon]|nr:hypothetical protein [Candidatus Methanomethylophilaceae archaeon]
AFSVRIDVPARDNGAGDTQIESLVVRARRLDSGKDAVVGRINIADDIESIELDMSDVSYIASAGLRVRNEKTKRVMEIFHLFGVEDPAQLPVEDPTA